MTITLIAAMSKNRVIGFENKLPWKLENDMHHFIQTTTGCNIVMGRKTFDDIGVLRNRKSFVLSTERLKGEPHKDVVWVKDIESILLLSNAANQDFIIIGGERTYRQFLPYATTIHLTTIYEEFEGDAFFPEYNKDDWFVSSRRTYSKSKGNPYHHKIELLTKT